MNRPSDVSTLPERSPSGVHLKPPDPDVVYVRAHRRGGFCVMIDGRTNPLARHDSAGDALLLAESLAKKFNARVVLEE